MAEVSTQYLLLSKQQDLSENWRYFTKVCWGFFIKYHCCQYFDILFDIYKMALQSKLTRKSSLEKYYISIKTKIWIILITICRSKSLLWWWWRQWWSVSERNLKSQVCQYPNTLLIVRSPLLVYLLIIRVCNKGLICCNDVTTATTATRTTTTNKL